MPSPAPATTDGTDDPTSDRAFVGAGLTLMLMSVSRLRAAPDRQGANFPDGGAALLVVDALRRQGASEAWLRHVGVGLKTLARVMIHHREDFAADLHPSEKAGWSGCAANIHLLGTAMTFEDEPPGFGPKRGPVVPLTAEVAEAISRDLSTASLGRVLGALELSYGLAHRLPADRHYSELSRLYAGQTSALLARASAPRDAAAERRSRLNR